MINCIIVDDEKLAREELKYILGEYKEIDVIGEASNAIEALKLIEDSDIDLMFLDIKMPQITGIELASILMDKKKAPKIIFVTAYDEYALKAFEVNAIDYLLKPIDEKQLERSMKNKVLNNLDLQKETNNLQELINYLGKDKEQIEKITVYHNNRMVPLDYKEIIYITVKDKETYIYTKDNEYLVSYTLNKLMDKLDKNNFFRSHKSFIVNLNYIEFIEEWFNATLNLKLKYIEEKIPVSRSNVKEFKCIMDIK